MTQQMPNEPGAEWQRYTTMLRAVRERLRNLRVDDPAIPACVEGLTRIEASLRRPLRIAVLGEYNSGKTSVTDLVIGKGLLPVSVIANTGVPVLVGHSEQPALFGVDAAGIAIRIDGREDDPLTDLDYRALEIRLPIPWLQNHQILDTPATLAPSLFATDADIAIWCTVATRAWTESERNLWSTVPARCFKTALLVATHKDSFYSDEDCAQVLQRLQSMTARLFRSVLLVTAAPPEASGGNAADLAAETETLRAAIETSAQLVRDRRLVKAKRIVQRLARLALHEFGRNAVRADAAPALEQWRIATDRLLAEHRTGRSSLDRTVHSLLHAFAYAAEALQPGVIRPPRADAPAGNGTATAAAFGAPKNAALLRADLTAVLRILASASRFELPDAREQRDAARATLLSLAELDTVFAGLDRWANATKAAPGGRTTELIA